MAQLARLAFGFDNREGEFGLKRPEVKRPMGGVLNHRVELMPKPAPASNVVRIAGQSAIRARDGHTARARNSPWSAQERRGLF
jgi:hypothetical protein